ncbi:sensor histidine kinase [Tenacibaculum sp. 190524A05c]|uniref:sensor histidine kinase n=1 Tax=Tenacibaculum platacis TaxID=3137852 RepID=UPI0031FABB38
MKKSGVFFIVLLILFGCNLASPKRSLKEKTDEVIQLQNLARKSQNNDSILYYVQQSQKLLDYNSEISDTLHLENKFLKGYYFKRKNNLDSARYYFHEVIKLVKNDKGITRNLVYFRNAWEMEELLNKIGNAISIAKDYIKIYEDQEIKYASKLMYAYNYLERANLDLRDYKEASKYNNKTLIAANNAGSIPMYITASCSKISDFYFTGKKNEAFKLLDSISKIKLGTDSKRQVNRSYGVLNFYEGKFKLSIKYYKKVIALTKQLEKEENIEANKVDHNYNFLEAYTNISEAYLEVKDYDLAKKYLDTTKTIIKVNSFEPYVDFYYSLRFLLNYNTKKEQNDVLTEYKELINDNKRTLRKNVGEKLYALQLANEKEKIVIKEKNELELRNIKLLALSGISVLLLVIGILFYRQRNYKFEKQEVQMQQRLLRSQMNSHFSFNTLSVIQDKIKDDQELAANYLTKFSRLLRLLLSNSLSNYVVIEDELDLLRKYLDLQLYRFPNAFEYKVELVNIEEDDILFIPPMLIQPFIENSIEHGFKGIDYKGKILIKLELLNEKYISCLIDDNGVGLKQTKKEYKNSISTNLISKFTQKITKRKISILDKKELKPKEKGVRVEFLIPYKFTNND